MVGQGYDNVLIARKLSIAEQTVKERVSVIYSKPDFHNRVKLMKQATALRDHMGTDSAHAERASTGPRRGFFVAGLASPLPHGESTQYNAPMRMSTLFSQTLREAPGDASSRGYALLVRAGFIRQLGAGIFTMMPLAKRSMDRIASIIRFEMDAIGGQELSMPVVHPGELWKESGRWYRIDAELSRFKDRADHDLVLAMTHEEVVGDLARREVRSYRQLPCLLYQVQTKWRDDPRPRAGLIRVREFVMKDSYSLDRDWEGLEKQYRAHYQAYFNIFHRCGLPVISVASDVGMMGGRLAHEYMYLTPIGEDTLLLCDECGYSANRQTARFARTAANPATPAASEEAPAEIEEVRTPGTKTIEDLATFLKVPAARTAKAVFYAASIADPAAGGATAGGATAGGAGAGGSAGTRGAFEPAERLVVALVRGDLELNETKLANTISARTLRPAREDEIRAAGIVPGFGSPIGARGAIVAVDESIRDTPNLVAGANREDYHLRNTNLGRDYSADFVADLAAARDGDPCPHCGTAMRTTRGVEVGNIFQLGTKYSDAMGARFLDQDGSEKPIIMGSYGIGLGRLLACVAEEHNDADGLAWPISVAPYDVHLIGISDGDPSIKQEASRQYDALRKEGIDVLWDDREERPGVKFKDADLIGLPLRITIGKRSLKAGGAEIKRRSARTHAEHDARKAAGDAPPPRDSDVALLASLPARVAALLGELRTDLAGTVTTVRYR